MTRFFHVMLFFAAAGLLAAAPLQAADLYWTGATGDYNDPLNWGGTLPIAGDQARVSNGGTANITVAPASAPDFILAGFGSGTPGAVGTINQTNVNLTLAGGLLYIGEGGGTGTYNISGGSLNMLSFGSATYGYAWRMGWGGTGYMTVTNGAVVTVTGRAYLGVLAGGTADLTVSGGSTLQTGGDFDLGFAGGSGTLTLSDTSTLNTAAQYLTMIGGAGGNYSTGSVGTLTATGTAAWNTGTTYVGYLGATGVVNLGTPGSSSGNVVTVSNKSFNIADSQNTLATKGTVNMYGTSKIVGMNGCTIGNWGLNDGQLNMTDHTVFTVSTGYLFVGHNQNGAGAISMSGSAHLDVLGGDFQLANSETWSGTTTGSLTMHDNASVNIVGSFFAGAFAGSNATVIMDGYSSMVETAGLIRIGDLDANGTFTMDGHTSVVNTGYQGTVIGSTNGVGTLNLNGNSVYQTVGISGTSNGTVNIDGGTLKASVTNANWLGTAVAYNVKAGGVKIDTNGFDAVVKGSLNEDSVSKGGGLTKMGQGKLTLSGSCAYTGTTTVQQGTLALTAPFINSNAIVVNSAGTLAGSGYANVYPTTTVNTGGTVAPGTPGELFYLNNLNLANNSNLKFTFDTSGNVDTLFVVGDVAAVGGSPVTVKVNYSGVIPSATSILYVGGNLPNNITFALPNPVLDSMDARTTSGAWLQTTYGPGGNVTLNPGGAIPDPAWSNAAGGLWSLNANWGSGPAPKTGDKRARFTASLGGSVPVTLDISPQLSSMIFDNPSGESYTITPTGGNFITLHSTVATDWHVSVLSGEHTVAADLKMAAGTGQSAVRLADNSHLTLSGVLSDETTAAGVNIQGNFNTGYLGNGVLTLSGANTYTGPTVVTNAVLEIKSLNNVAVANPLGKSSVDPANLVINNSELYYSGTASASTDRGITVNNGIIKNDGNLTIGGKVTTTNTVNSYFNKEGAGTLTFNSPAGLNDFGYNIGTEYYPKAGKTVFDGVAGTEYKAWIIHTGTNFKTDMDVINNAKLTVAALPMGWGDNNGSAATVTMSGNSSASVFYWIYMGVGTNALADVTMSDHASITNQVDGYGYDIGYAGGEAKLTMDNHSSIMSAGTVNMGANGKATVTMSKNSSITAAWNVFVGTDVLYSGVASEGHLTMNDEAKVSAAGWLLLGNDGVGSLTLNNKASVVVSGDLLTCGNGAATGTSGEIKLNGTSSLTAGGRVWIGTGASGTIGTVTLVDTPETLNNPTFTANGTVTLGSYGGTGTLNLNGGTFAANAFLTSQAASTGTVNFNGGTMKALAANAEFFATDDPGAIVTLNVKEGGAKFDTNGFNVKTAQALTGSVGDGGLAKLGDGTLMLAGPISYTGPTTIAAGGRLAIDNGLTTTLTTITGDGAFSVGNTQPGTVVIATSIEVGELTIGSGLYTESYAAAAQADTGFRSGGTTAVPEPSTLILLALAGMVAVLSAWRRK